MRKTRKMSKAIMAGVLSMAMVIQPMTAFAVESTGDTSEFQDGDTLYLVNCATTDPSVVPSGYDMGSCQSNVDQEYGQDSTGYSWGYDEKDLSGKTDGSSPSDLTSSSWYISDGAVYDEATSGIKYEFDLPEGVDSVEVTAGVFIPQWWDDRTVVIELEGEDAGSMSCVDNVLSEETYTVNVDDGVLNFRAKAASDRGDDANKDPMLSYIIVKANVEEEEPEDPSVLTIQSVDANSYQSGNEANLAIDGNTGTHWHSSWATGHPTVADGLYITMDMGQEVSNLSQLTYTPRQDRDSNGIYTEYEISVSTDGSEYTKVAEGTWAADKDVKTATFPETAARYVRLTAVHTMGNSDSEADQYACAAELALGAVGDWDREAEKAALNEALAVAKEYLESDNGKNEIELERLNGMVEDAEKISVDGYLAVKEELSGLADDITAEVERLENNEPYVTYDSITGTAAERMYDNNGNKIQAHGGQVQKIGDTWYWYGEDKTNGYRPVEGVHCYSSTDLYNWKDEGLALDAIDVPDEHYGDDSYVDLSIFETDEELKALYGDYAGQPSDDPTYETKLEEVYWNLAEDRCVMERPKVLYNESTGQYVMWWHCDGRTPTNTADYGKARAGVAVADNPAGPFKFVGTYLLASDPDRTSHGFDSEGGHVRDMNVFKDDDGTAYVLYSSEGNEVMYIARLNDSYTGLAKDPEDMIHGEDFATISTDSREAPAMFKYNGMYYLITSGCTGWAPNQAAYAVAEDPMGPWTRMGDPCVGDTDRNTFWTQSTCVIPVDPENGEFIYMGDRWYNPDNGADISDSRYVWLPIEFGSDNTIMIKDYSNWTLDELKGKGAISVDTEFPETTTSVSNLMESLPDTVDVTIGDTQYTGTPVEWSMDDRTAALGDYALGDVTVTGNLTELNREFTVTAFNCPASLVYFADCATGTDNPSEIYDRFAEGADELLNMVSDQAYGNDGGINWGYTSTPGASGAGDSQDMGSHTPGSFYDSGWWATSSGTIDYSFELEPGNYAVMTGYQEWWSSTRGIKITATSVDAEGNETEIGTTTFTLSGEQDMQQRTDMTVPEDSDHVIVSISKASGSDPVLSWIGIVSTDEQTEPAAENLVKNGSFEDGATGWNLGNGASVQKGDDAPDGTQYLRDNGDANTWGDGSSQTVGVEPDTEYVLTGSAKVDGSDPYYAGANVDGREIYAVFSTDSSYTDTTDNADKLAYEVHAGAADWTDFEIRFTTGPETTSVNVYTWIDSGYGYLDNVVLKEVTGRLDWTEFDELMSEIDAMDEAEYTEDSWAEFQTVVAEAKEFKENATDETKQREIRQMISTLEEAMEKLISIHEPTGDVTYYVDAENGDDNNDGTSPETAWKSLEKASSIRQLKEGGSILLKAGSVWNGEQLTVKNALGTEENPVVIGSYGEGAKPVINGNGANWDADTKEELAAVHIYNSENIVIENLEITNWDETAVPGSGWTYGQSSKLLSGLVVENKDAGALSNVVVRNNKIHDVNGRMAGGADKAAGGLIVVVTGGGSNHTGKVESWYDGLTIDGNEVYNVCHEAIYMESVWASRTLVGGTSSDTGYQNAGNSNWVGSNDVVIENNYVHDVAGDGIVPINTTDALVQYNLIDNAADTNWDYSANVNHAALWTWDSDNVTFRYNEASNSSKGSAGEAMLPGTNDSMAFDFDYGVQNCLYEYNYSHDNYGGFLMLCPGPGATVNNIARYNLSVNDGRYNGAPMIRVGGGKYGSNGVQIYNNTMYWEGNGGYASALAPASDWEGSVVTDVSIFNNIFYGPATDGSVKQSEGVSYYNNLVYSSDGSAQKVYQAAAGDENAVYEDPMFVDTTDFTSGSWADGKTTLGTAEGFKIKEDSPAVNAGADHPDAPASSPSAVADELVPNTTDKPLSDYYGNALTDGKNDIGANEYTAEETKELKITANPEDVEGAAGENAVFTVAAEGSGLSYQWQYANAGSSVWRASSMSGSDTPEITVPIASYRDGQQYRCVVTDRDGNSVTSESATITMIIPEDTPVITSQPEDFVGTAGEMAVFEVEADGTGLTYQWQYCNEGSNVWRNSSMAGSTTAAISVEIASYRDGQKYRCVVTSESGYSATSEAAAIIIGVADDAPHIDSQPVSYEGAAGETAVFEVKASGTDLTYQWQYCNANSNVWRTSSMKGNGTSTLSVPVTAARDGQKYRCVITSGTGRVVTTETAVLTVTAE